MIVQFTDRESGVKYSGVSLVSVAFRRLRRRRRRRRPNTDDTDAMVGHGRTGRRRSQYGCSDAQLTRQPGGHQQRPSPSVLGHQPAQQGRVDERSHSDPGRRQTERKTDQPTAATVKVDRDDGDERHVTQAEPDTCIKCI